MSIGDKIVHYGGIRLRATGSGNLKLKYYSLSGVYTQNLTTIVLAANTERYPTVLTNFTQQAAQLELRTEELGEQFHIRKIIVYTLPVATSYPG